MKKIFVLISAALLTLGLNAQVEVPQPSPAAKVEQVIGLTDVTVEYSRPSMKGRTIFGDLVPFDKLWRTGANKNTMITFGNDVSVNGKELKKGSYAIFTKPGKDSWDVTFYTDTSNWGTPSKWDDAKVAATVAVKPSKLPMQVETFTMMFNDLTMDSGKLFIIWADQEVALDIVTKAKEQSIASIEKTMAGPSANDYYQAAVFYKNIKDFGKAKEHIEKAVASRADAFWYHRQHSLILAGNKDKSGAIKAAKKSLELAEKAGNADYVKMNKDSLKEWGAM